MNYDELEISIVRGTKGFIIYVSADEVVDYYYWKAYCYC